MVRIETVDPIPRKGGLEVAQEKIGVCPQVQEPMIKINSTGYGIHASTIIYAAVTLFIGGGAWYNLQASQQSFLERIETIQASLAEERADRNLVANALKAREIDDAADRARRDEQISNMNMLIADLRKNVDRLNELLQSRVGGASKMEPLEH